MAFNMYGKSTLEWNFIIDFSISFSICKDIDKNGRVDAKEMEQIVTVRIQ